MEREIDAEKIRSEAKRAIENLGELSGSTQAHTVELCLQHIWTAAGGETGKPGTDEYMAVLYPDGENGGEDASERTRAGPEDDDSEWEFESGDIIREERGISVDSTDSEKSEYKIERLLRTESAGNRFYHVENEEGEMHLYLAAAVETGYDEIDPAESSGWTEGEDGPERR